MNSQRPLILVVEIEKPDRDSIVSILNSAGYDCLEADSGASAIDLLRSNARIRLILSNMLLSADIDGLTLLRHVKQRYPRIPFVVITYIADEEVRGEAIRNGTDGYLLKPFESRQFLGTVHEALAKNRQSSLRDSPHPSSREETVQWYLEGAVLLAQFGGVVLLAYIVIHFVLKYW